MIEAGGGKRIAPEAAKSDYEAEVETVAIGDEPIVPGFDLPDDEIEVEETVVPVEEVPSDDFVAEVLETTETTPDSVETATVEDTPADVTVELEDDTKSADIDSEDAEGKGGDA